MIKKKISPIVTFILLLVGMASFKSIPLMFFNININDFSNGMRQLYNFGCSIGFMIILFFLYKEMLVDDIKEFFKDFKSKFKISLKYYAIGLLIMVVSTRIIELFFTGAIASNEDTIRNMIDNMPIYMIFEVSLYAPFIEELIFRKSIKDCVMIFGENKFTKYLFIVISGLIFSSLHVLGSVKSALDYLYIIPYLGLGLAFATMYVKSENIYCSMMMHSLHNICTIILYFIMYACVRF